MKLKRITNRKKCVSFFLIHNPVLYTLWMFQVNFEHKMSPFFVGESNAGKFTKTDKQISRGNYPIPEKKKKRKGKGWGRGRGGGRDGREGKGREEKRREKRQDTQLFIDVQRYTLRRRSNQQKAEYEDLVMGFSNEEGNLNREANLFS